MKLTTFQSAHPTVVRVLRGVVPERITETGVYLDRAARIILGNKTDAEYNAENMWSQNRGIDNYNSSNLNNDPLFLHMTQDLFDSTRELDREFAARIRIRRDGLSIVGSTDHGLLIDDLPGVNEFFQ